MNHNPKDLTNPKPNSTCDLQNEQISSFKRQNLDNGARYNQSYY